MTSSWRQSSIRFREVKTDSRQIASKSQGTHIFSGPSGRDRRIGSLALHSWRQLRARRGLAGRRRLYSSLRLRRAPIDVSRRKKRTLRIFVRSKLLSPDQSARCSSEKRLSRLFGGCSDNDRLRLPCSDKVLIGTHQIARRNGNRCGHVLPSSAPSLGGWLLTPFESCTWIVYSARGHHPKASASSPPD
jgi:hypothetical protein